VKTNDDDDERLPGSLLWVLLRTFAAGPFGFTNRYVDLVALYIALAQEFYIIIVVLPRHKRVGS
jgi:hypothetical protein